MAEAKLRGKPLDPKVKERIAWFIGVGATQEETAGACDVHRSTVAKVMADPAYRKQADDIARKRTSLRAEVRAVFADALNAFDSDGNPAYAVRSRAAEALAKNSDLLEAEGDEEELDATMLPGVTMLYPFADEAVEMVEHANGHMVPDVRIPQAILPVSPEHNDDGGVLIFSEEDFES